MSATATAETEPTETAKDPAAGLRAALTEAHAKIAWLESHAQHASGYVYRLASPLATIHIQTDGFGHWAIFLNAPKEYGAWTGSEWGPTSADHALLYRWTLAGARAEIDALLAKDAVEWDACWTNSANATPIHDGLALRTSVNAEAVSA